MQSWRWDQGRLQYFAIAKLRDISAELAALDGSPLKGEDPLRDPLKSRTGLNFDPQDYHVWRNYARVFGCALLATKRHEALAVTDICRALARPRAGGLTDDEFLGLVIRRFYVPSPVFTGYAHNGARQFPFCAIIRFLLSRRLQVDTPSVSVEDVFSWLIGNNVTGEESLETLAGLRNTNYTAAGDQLRQVREMLKFVGQARFLKYIRGRLHLDLHERDQDAVRSVELLATPTARERLADKTDEFLALGALTEADVNAVKESDFAPSPIDSDALFAEGSRVRVSHLRIERSPQLRRAFLDSLDVVQCDACGLLPLEVYPWAGKGAIEAHHLLPLASAIALSKQGATLNDLVALCPNCHRAVHDYYRHWLNDHGEDDFASEDQAREIYAEVRALIRNE